MSIRRAPTKYWRFAYDESNLKNILSSGTLSFPDFKKWPSAKSKSVSEVSDALSVGCFVFLANFNEFEKIGTVRGVGKIINITDGGIEVVWKKVVPSWSLATHTIASVQWSKDPVFCFNVKPVKEFKLDVRSSKLFFGL